MAICTRKNKKTKTNVIYLDELYYLIILNFYQLKSDLAEVLKNAMSLSSKINVLGIFLQPVKKLEFLA